MVRAKFRVTKLTQYTPTQFEVTLSALMDDKTEENRRYHKYTPQGSITMMIDNPPASAYFGIGKTVYVDFSDAPE